MYLNNIDEDVKILKVPEGIGWIRSLNIASEVHPVGTPLNAFTARLCSYVSELEEQEEVKSLLSSKHYSTDARKFRMTPDNSQGTSKKGYKGSAVNRPSTPNPREVIPIPTIPFTGQLDSRRRRDDKSELKNKIKVLIDYTEHLYQKMQTEKNKNEQK